MSSKRLQNPISLLALLCLGASVSAVEIGDTMEDVRLELGNPQGVVKAEDLHVWLYPNGELEFEDDRVSSVALMSPEAFKDQQQALLKAAEKRQDQREEAERRQREATDEVRQQILQDPAYTNQTPAERIDTWETFSENHPEAEIPDDVQAQLEEDQETLEDRRREEERRRAEAEAAKEPEPVLSGSKSKKRLRGAGKVKPEDRPSFMTRQTLFD